MVVTIFGPSKAALAILSEKLRSGVSTRSVLSSGPPTLVRYLALVLYSCKIFRIFHECDLATTASSAWLSTRQHSE